MTMKSYENPENEDAKENKEHKVRNSGLWMIVALSLIISACIVALLVLPRDNSMGYVILHGFVRGFYVLSDLIVLLSAALGILILRFLMKQNRTTGFKIRWGIEIGMLSFILVVFLLVFVLRLNRYHKVPAYVSPDGSHILYEDGGDSDIFVNSSGYMHYVLETDEYHYSRAFYTFDDEFTPEIVWYDDGFLVKYKCPEDTYISGDSLAPESDLSNLFQWESREKGYFFYYRKNSTGGTSMYQHITQEEAGRIMKEEQGYILLDVRTKAEFDKKHIPGAVCIPVTSINKNRAAEELPDVSQTILVYCRSGHRAQIAAKKLSDLGYTDVREFGGILDWTGETVSE